MNKKVIHIFLYVLLITLTINVKATTISSTGSSKVIGYYNGKYVTSWTESHYSTTSYQYCSDYYATDDPNCYSIMKSYIQYCHNHKGASSETEPYCSSTSISYKIFYCVKSGKWDNVGNCYESETACLEASTTNSKSYDYIDCELQTTYSHTVKNYKCNITGKIYSSSKWSDPKAICKSNCKQEKTETRVGTCSSVGKYKYCNNLYKALTTTQTFSAAKTGTLSLSSASYNIYENGKSDSAYCISPGLSGPAGTEYLLNDSFDFSKCDDAYYAGNKTNYACGLAAILLQTVTRKKDSLGRIYYESNGKYSYYEILTALRLWAAHFTKYVGTKTVTYESDDYTYYAGTRVYTNTDIFGVTADAALDGKYSASNGYAISCSGLDNGILCGTGTTYPYQNAVKLFLNARYHAAEYFEDYLVEDVTPEVYVTQNKEKTNEYTITIDLPETLKEEIVACTKEEMINNSSSCVINVTIKDKDNKNVTSSLVKSGYCNKEKCYLVVEGTKCVATMDQKVETVTEYTVTTTVKNTGYNPSGYIRQYRNKNNPSGRQIFMTAAFSIGTYEIWNNKISKLSDRTSVINKIEMPCGCSDTSCKLSEVSSSGKNDGTAISKALSKARNNCDKSNGTKEKYDSYVVINASDAYDLPTTECVTSVCASDESSDRSKYNLNSTLKADSKVCDIYCTDEITFILPTRTKVNSGRQFYYDLLNKMNSEDKGKLIKTTSSYKITAITLVKRKCASKIYYSAKGSTGKNFETLLTEALNRMAKAERMAKSNKTNGEEVYKEYKTQVVELIIELLKCNFYTQEQITSTISQIISDYGLYDNFSKGDYMTIINNLIANNETIGLSVSYADEEYGSEKNFGKEVITKKGNVEYYSTYNNKTKTSTTNKTKKVAYIRKEQENESNSTYYTPSNSATIKLPTNNYAVYEATVQANYYNPVKYATEAYTGKVVLASEASSSKSPIKLASEIFPVSTHAKSKTDNVVKFKFNGINNYINVDTEYSYTCYYDNYTEYTDKTDTDDNLGFVYRTIDLDDVFVDGKTPSTNWSTNSGTKATKEIEKNGNTIYADNSSKIQYSYTLTPSSVKKIKEYNEDKEYQNETLSNCTLVDSSYNINCKSEFLTTESIKKYGIVNNVYSPFINSQVGGN